MRIALLQMTSGIDPLANAAVLTDAVAQAAALAALPRLLRTSTAAEIEALRSQGVL